MRDGAEVDGPPFEPYTDTLRKLAAAGIDVGVLPPDDRPRTAPRIGKNVGRFDYWARVEVNPWADRLADQWVYDREQPSKNAHALLSEHYRPKVEDGDEEAAFEYVARDAWAFRAAWLQRLIERWRDAGDQPRLTRLMSRYAARDGKRKPSTIRDQIQRDLQVYEDLLAQARSGCPVHKALDHVGSTHALSPAAVKEIRDAYTALWKRVETLQLFATPEAMLQDLQATVGSIAIEADPT